MKFVVDGMLGKLAKWLKILGFDVSYSPLADDDTLLRVARSEGRTLLSRDRSLLGRTRGLKALLIGSERWEEQVRQVLDHFGLRDEAQPYSRCLECNVRLKPLPKSQASNLVAPFVLEHGTSFALCPRCGRVYWKGTHFEAMEAKLAKLLNEKPKKRIA
jgi:uncharacterized protein with PIN domain